MQSQFQETTEETPQYKSTPPTATQKSATVAATQTTQVINVRAKALNSTRYSAIDLNVSGAFALILGGIIGMIIGAVKSSQWKDLPWPFFGGILVFIGAVIGVYFNKRIADEKLELDKLNADKKELQDQFVDIQNRFAAKEEIMRANAALRLWEFAIQPRPRTMTEIRDNPNLPVTRDNYPYFLRAASQLATALHMETNDAVRKNIVEALGRMAAWKALPDDNALLTELINKIVAANRIAKDNFIRAFAAWMSVDKRWLDIEEMQRLEAEEGEGGRYEEEAQERYDSINSFLISVAGFGFYPEVTEAALNSLQNEIGGGNKVTKFSVALAVQREKRKRMLKEEQDKDSALHLPALQTASNALNDARDALASALNQLKPINASRRKEPLDLSYCFLSGAILEKVQLSEADLTGSHLQGADLTVANLEKAILRWAHFQMAILNKAHLQGAFVEETNFEKAKFFKADLRELFLFHTGFRDADLSYAQLQEAMTSDAYFHRTKIAGSDIDKARDLPEDWENTFDFRQGDGNIDYKLKQRVKAAIENTLPLF